MPTPTDVVVLLGAPSVLEAAGVDVLVFVVLVSPALDFVALPRPAPVPCQSGLGAEASSGTLLPLLPLLGAAAMLC